MEKDYITKIVLNVLKLSMPDTSVEIKTNSSLQEDLGLCSFDMMVLLRLLSEHNLEIDATQLICCTTVQDLIDNIKEQK